MRSLVFALAAMFWASAVTAQVVQVRSGQHDGFTRLIVELPERLEVQIENKDRAATITFPNQALTFDTAPVYHRISRDRVANVRSDAGRGALHVEFGCDCQVDSFWHDKSLLVLDIRKRTGEVPQANSPEPSLKTETAAPARPRLTLPQETRSFAASLANAQLEPRPSVNPHPTDPTDSPDIQPVETNEATLSDARERLVKQIGRAASQGLLSPRARLQSEPSPQKDDAKDEPLVEEAPMPPAVANPAVQVNLQAQSSIDRDFLAMMTREISKTEGFRCLDTHLVDVGAWGTDTPFALQVGALRQSLMGEFDELNHDAALRLAKLYLYFGFGAEARLMLDLIEEPSQEVSILRSMAAVIEIGHAPVGSPLLSQLECEGPAALWSVLSHQAIPADTSIDHDSLLRSFTSWPRHLRSYLGPVLSRRLLDAGHQDTADKVLRILNRHEETQTTGAQLVEAEMELSEGAHTQASERMEEIIETNSEPSAQALIGLIDTRIQAQESVSYDHAVLAGAYAQQNRGGALEQDLIRVYLTGLAASGAYDQSYEEYSRLGPNLPTKTQYEISSELLHQLTANADEIAFLHHVLARHAEHGETLTPEVANAAAERLLDLGFAAQAKPFVEHDATGDAGRTRRILRARISLAESQPHQAEAHLIGLAGDAAKQLRAQARDLAGDHRAAADLYLANGQVQESLRQSWLAEDWTSLMSSQDDMLSDVAALVTSNANGALNTNAAEEERSLARNRGLIQQSTTTREMIETVLQASPSPD